MMSEKFKMQLSCPMPKFDFDTIQLGHGSGGILTHNLLNSGVFNIFKNDVLNEKHDGAVVELCGRLAVSTDSYVVHPIFFPGGNIGELAINGTVNDLAMCGAAAKYLSLAFILEEGLSMEEFWQVLDGMNLCAQRAGITIITGDTKVVEKNKGDKMFINTTGIGEVHPLAQIGLKYIQPGDAILINNSIAAHGIAIMSVREGLEFSTTICSDTTNLNFTIKRLIDQVGRDIHFFRDATRGGLASVLNEIAKDGGFGISIDQKYIPVNEQVQGACEMLGLDPLYVANEGVFITVVSANRADELLDTLRKDVNGAKAERIGTVTSDHSRQVILNSVIGGRRIVNMLPGEQLPRIC